MKMATRRVTRSTKKSFGVSGGAKCPSFSRRSKTLARNWANVTRAKNVGTISRAESPTTGALYSSRHYITPSSGNCATKGGRALEGGLLKWATLHPPLVVIIPLLDKKPLAHLPYPSGKIILFFGPEPFYRNVNKNPNTLCTKNIKSNDVEPNILIKIKRC